MENRQPRQERSEETLQAIIAAAASELLDHGMNAVTHRGVAERAQSSLRSTTYYFKSVKALRREAARLIFAAGNRTREEHLTKLRIKREGELVDWVITFAYGENLTVPGVIRFQTNLLQGAEDEAYSELIAETQHTVENQVQQLLDIFNVKQDARKVIAAMDGRLLEWVLGGGETNYRENIKHDLGI
jgi:DNA-binding transcriptional regulator YbjK